MIEAGIVRGKSGIPLRISTFLFVFILSFSGLAVSSGPESGIMDGLEIERELQSVTSRIQNNTNRIILPGTGAEDRARMLQENELLRRYAAGLRARLDRMSRGEYLEVFPLSLPELRSAGMNEIVVDAMLDLFGKFAELENRKKTGAVSPLGEEWNRLAMGLESFSPLTMSAAAAGQLTRQNFGQYGLRALLLAGKAHLYASAAWYAQPPPGRPEVYRESYYHGIAILEQVIRLARDDIERLDIYERPGPRAFMEVVGVHRTDLGIDLQYPTSVAARRALQEYCPWGREVLLLLDQAGLTGAPTDPESGRKGLDLGILRPYSGDGVFRFISPFWSRFVAGLQTPRVWERRLTDRVPEALRLEVEAIVGDETDYTGLINRSGVTEKIEWAVGVRPREHFTLVVVSPAVFDLTPAGLAAGLLTAVDYSFKTTLEKLIDAGLYVFGRIVQELCGEDSIVTITTKLLIDGKGHYDDIQSLRLDGNPAGIVRAVAAAAFNAVEEQEMQMLFDGVEVDKITLGRSYDGIRIPPVFVVADIMGYERVKTYEYHRLRHIRMAWRLHPEVWTGQKDYDLRGELPALSGRTDYFSHDAGVREASTRHVWRRMEGTMGLREHVITVEPRAQVLRIRLPEEDYRQWQRSRPGERGTVELKALLHAPAETSSGYTREPLLELPLTGRGFSIQLFSNKVLTDCPDGTDPDRFYQASFLRYRPPAVNVVNPYNQPRLHYRALKANRINRSLVTSLTTEYYLRILRNDREVGEFYLNFGPRDKNRPMQGRITYNSQGVATLAYPADEDREVVVKPIDVRPIEINLLPTTLRVLADHWAGTLVFTGQAAVGVQEMELASHRGEITFSIQLLGSDLRPGRYRVRVDIGPQSYTAWGRVSETESGTVLFCTVFVPVGRHNAVVNVPGMPEYGFMIHRPKSDIDRTAGVERYRQGYERALSEYLREPTPQRLSNMAEYASWYARDLLFDDRCEEAYRLCRAVLQVQPGHSFPVRFYEHFFTAAFRAGDREGMVWAGTRQAEQHDRQARQLVEAEGRGGPRVTNSAGQAMAIYADTITRFISLGGDSAGANELMGKMFELWELTGYSREDRPMRSLNEVMKMEFPLAETR